MRLVYEPLTEIPKGFTEVEYLESTGTQYIDTGVLANGSFKAKYKIYIPSSFTNFIVAGARSPTQHLNFGQYEPSGNFIMAYLGDYWIAGSPTTSNSYFETEINYKSGSQTAKVNGVSMTSGSYTGTEELNMNIYLFKRNFHTPSSETIQPMKGRIYYFKIWKDDELVRDFIPCLDASNVPCMYDKVEGKAYYNAGTGTFSYGRKIIPVEYLESTGTQYIDTGYIVPNGAVMDYNVSILSEPSGANCGCGVDYGGLHFVYDKQNHGLRTGGGSATNAIPYTFGTKVSIHTYYTSANIRMLDALGQTYTGSYYLNPNLTAYLFATHTITGVSNPGSMRVYNSKIYNDNGVLVRDYIPVRDENNVGYMFDRVTHTLFANAGTGDFLYKDYEEPIELINNPKYIQVEYLEATGTQYIDTGIRLSNTHSVELKLQTSGAWVEQSVFGARRGASDNNFTIQIANDSASTQFHSGNSVIVDFNNSSYITYRVSKSYVEGQDYTCYISSTKRSVDENIQTTTCSDVFTNQTNAYLFSISGAPFSQRMFTGKIYYCTIWDNGVLIRDFIPAIRKSDNKPGMYDKVTGNFYTNAGTGEFITGNNITPLPSAYEELEYIESTTATTGSGPYIDTGIEALNTTSFMIDFSFTTTAYGQGMGQGYLGGKRFSVVGFYLSGGSTYFGYAYNSWYDTDVAIDTNRHTFELDAYNKKYYLDNHTYNIPNVSYTSEEKTIGLFCRICNSNGTTYPNWFCAGKMYGAKIKQNGVLVRDFTPCYRKSDGEVGMYDKVTGQFFGNSGTGAFVKGEKAKVLRNKICRLVGGTGVRYVDGYRMVDYLQSSGTQWIDTGVKAKSTLKTDIYFEVVDKTQGGHIFGGRTVTSGGRGYGVYLPTSGGIGFDYETRLSSNVSTTNGYKYRVVKDGESNTLYVNDVQSYTGNNTAETFDLNVNMALFYMKDSNTSFNASVKCKVFYFKIWDGNNIVRDFVPVLDENNVPCMYDKVTKALFKNQGSGDFTYGSILEGNINRIIQSGI